MRGIFVTGTDTGAGKTVVAAAACAGLAGGGAQVAAFKPAVTGLDEPAEAWPPDHELLAAVASCGQAPDEVSPYRFGPPVSPHLAADAAGGAVSRARVVGAAQDWAARADAIVVEGVGGLLVPLTAGYSVRSFAADLGLPLVVAARPGLGTINHTLLTLEAARTANLSVAGVVLTPWPEAPTTLERSNRETIERLGGVEVRTLPPTDPSSLARAARELPLERWLEVPSARQQEAARLAPA